MGLASAGCIVARNQNSGEGVKRLELWRREEGGFVVGPPVRLRWRLAAGAVGSRNGRRPPPIAASQKEKAARPPRQKSFCLSSSSYCVGLCFGAIQLDLVFFRSCHLTQHRIAVGIGAKTSSRFPYIRRDLFPDHFQAFVFSEAFRPASQSVCLPRAPERSASGRRDLCDGEGEESFETHELPCTGEHGHLSHRA